jgi:hypothetical protein
MAAALILPSLERSVDLAGEPSKSFLKIKRKFRLEFGGTNLSLKYMSKMVQISGEHRETPSSTPLPPPGFSPLPAAATDEWLRIARSAQLHLVACGTNGKQRTNDQNAGKLPGQTGNRR